MANQLALALALLLPSSSLAQPGDILVMESAPAGYVLWRVNPVSSTKSVVSGCVDQACSAIVGSGPSLNLGSVSAGTAVASEPAGTILVMDRDPTTLGARLIRIDPATGNRTLLVTGAFSGIAQDMTVVPQSVVAGSLLSPFGFAAAAALLALAGVSTLRRARAPGGGVAN